MPVDLASNAVRRNRLRDTLRGSTESRTSSYDVVVTLNEVNNRHGTGVLVQRLYPDDSHVLSIRSASHYGGNQSFGHMQLALPDGCTQRGDIYRWVLDMTEGLDIQRILCVPFEDPDLLLAIALRDALQVPFGLYVMDDHNVRAGGISDALMAEAISKSSVRLAISSDMRDAYHLKYRERFWIAPPTVERSVGPITASEPPTDAVVIIGNIWGRSWLEALRETVRASGLAVDWFANSPKGGWLDVPPEDLVRDGIRLRGPVPETELPLLLGRYQAAIHPNGPDGSNGENAGVATLSLPTRIPLILCASNLPVIVLGDPATCAARFVSHFGVGVACKYDAASLRGSLEDVRRARWRQVQAASLQKLRPLFQVSDMGAWIRDAIDAGRPPSLLFEALEVPPMLVPRYLPEAPKLGPWLADFESISAAMTLVSNSGYQPDFVIDVGASTGVWSEIVSRTFPRSQFVLVEPLAALYATGRNGPRGAVVIEAAVSSAAGNATLYVDPNLYGSSLISETIEGTQARQVSVPVTTLDVIANDAKLSGRGILKLDIQGGELAALEGASKLLPLIDLVVVEVTCDPATPNVPSFTQVHRAMEDSGYVYFDDVGEWRDPKVGVLLQKDVMYARRDTPIASLRRAHGRG